MPERIKILVAEDDGLLRRTMVELLKLESDFDVVSDVPNGRMAVDQAPHFRPDVALMDIDMPLLNGIEATKHLKGLLPELRVVILTKFGDDENLFAAIKAGAIGYILKDSGLEEIRTAIRDAYAGDGHLNPALVTRLMAEFNRISKQREDSRQLFAELTRREMEVLELLGAGMKNKAIAERLFLSEKTVKHHIGAILRKLHVNGRTEAALIAQEHGLSGDRVIG